MTRTERLRHLRRDLDIAADRAAEIADRIAQLQDEAAEAQTMGLHVAAIALGEVACKLAPKLRTARDLKRAAELALRAEQKRRRVVSRAIERPRQR